MKLFTELDFRLSVVKRWTVISTLRKQSLAEHTLNVIILAERIARQWFGITDEAKLYQIVRRALYHDYFETISGDYPSYMKRFVMETGAEAEFADLLEGVDVHEKDELVHVIIKIADYTDACIFLRMEISHGNVSVTSVLHDLERRFNEWCDSKLINNAKVCAGVYQLYLVQVVDELFGSNGQFRSEVFRF